MLWVLCLHILAIASMAVCCISCDSATLSIFNDLKNEYVDRNIRAEQDKDVEPSLEIRRRAREALGTFLQHPCGSDIGIFKVIDDAHLYTLSSTLRSLMKRVMSTDHKGEDLLVELVWLTQELEKTTRIALLDFYKNDFCPNKCGVLYQEVLDCITCTKTVNNCQQDKEVNLNCGGNVSGSL
ncbi:izumo sperm-egg fusion protein 1 [Ambystoma mexicanum]|uniref:izumo sperm-egg fusion protein 1 n=1 Tax=Ambystoma mexicanum TaxID=8296 RepID=UPI0037E8971C